MFMRAITDTLRPRHCRDHDDCIRDTFHYAFEEQGIAAAPAGMRMHLTAGPRPRYSKWYSKS
jgi:hypothetical protein